MPRLIRSVKEFGISSSPDVRSLNRCRISIYSLLGDCSVDLSKDAATPRDAANYRTQTERNNIRTYAWANVAGTPFGVILEAGRLRLLSPCAPKLKNL